MCTVRFFSYLLRINLILKRSSFSCHIWSVKTFLPNQSWCFHPSLLLIVFQSHHGVTCNFPPVSSCPDHQLTRNFSLRHMTPSRPLHSYQAQCGLILHSLTWPQSLTMKSSIKFWPILYYYLKEFSRLLGYHFEMCGSCCRQVINAAIFWLASQRLWAHQTPSCILLYQHSVRDRRNNNQQFSPGVSTVSACLWIETLEMRGFTGQDFHQDYG